MSAGVAVEKNIASFLKLDLPGRRPDRQAAPRARRHRPGELRRRSLRAGLATNATLATSPSGLSWCRPATRACRWSAAKYGMEFGEKRRPVGL
jgi:hypothetical protein